MSDRALVGRLRDTAQRCSAWPTDMYPPLTEWAMLMEQAADRIEEQMDSGIIDHGDERNWP